MGRDPVRVRIAPSPTGFFHVGTARSALYNWLFARHHGGRFILRIEDTDPARSRPELIQPILDGLNWLGLDIDEGPYYQSHRLEIYKRYAQRLIDSSQGYFCYCRPEELAQERKAAQAAGRPWRYDRRCLNLSSNRRQALEASDRPRAIRYLVPPRRVVFSDLIHNQIECDSQEIEDFVIMRADNTPTYNFACVVDDYEMGITHVIRAVEHLPNTPKQILLYEALNLPLPQFAHLPLILGPDRCKISKRHGAVSLMEYKAMGFLPEAMFNFLALLGWSPGGDREILSREAVVELFSLERVNRANAIFDIRKLEWMNGEYMGAKPDKELLRALTPYLISAGVAEEAIAEEESRLERMVGLWKSRTRRLSELARAIKGLVAEPVEYDPEAVERFLDPLSRTRLRELRARFASLTQFTAPELEAALRSLAQELGVKPAALIHPCRVAITGRTVGPPLFDTLEAVGRDLVLKRLDKLP